jgi:hypothetical protein
MTRSSAPLLALGMAVALILPLFVHPGPESTMLSAGDVATPSPDRLAPPVVPELPTQVDLGRSAYHYHCMPCHGDRGQGLTLEWRQAWVEDHQDCWARGCHAGREGDEGFALARYVPPVSGSPQAIASFRTADQLFQFLFNQHPPQRPGALAEDEYWALTAFLLYENGRLASSGQVGPADAGSRIPGIRIVVAISLGAILVALFIRMQNRYRPAIVAAQRSPGPISSNHQDTVDSASREGEGMPGPS